MPWIGFDFDGTLAEEFTLAPVPKMMERLKTYLKNGTEVRIVTARAGHPEGIELVEKWLENQGLPVLQITDKKDYNMIVLYDDRAIQVIRNTGIIVGEK